MSQYAFTRYFDTQEELIAFLTKAPAGGSATKTADTSSKPAAKTTTKKAGVTQSQMQTALNKVKDELGIPDAKAIISEVGGVKKMDDIPEAKYEAVFKACEAKLADAAGEEEGEEDGDGSI